MIKYIVAAFLICAITTDAQNQKLKVGDRAPTVNAIKWIKGNRIAAFEKGKVYVVEFGSTWCGPCVKAIPHLTKLAKDYEDKAVVLGVFVMEVNTEPLDTKSPKYVRKVERFVEKQGDKMGYNVAVDTPDRFMQANWLNAAGINGIPYSFVVDEDGFIAWVGVSTNTEVLKQALDYVLSDGYELSKMVRQAEFIKKNTIQYDPKKPLLIDGNGGDDQDYMFRSIIKKANVRLAAAQNFHFDTRSWFDKTLPEEHRTKRGRAQWVSMEPIDLYRLAYGDTLQNQAPPSRHPSIGYKWMDEWNPFFRSVYGESWHTPILEVKNPKLVGAALWRNRNSRSIENKYHYSVQVPEEMASTAFVQEVMQRDLQNYFGYDVNIEIREIPCWKITATATTRKHLKTKTPNKKYKFEALDNGTWVITNAIMKDVIWSLGGWYGVRQYGQVRLDPKNQLPFIDETGIDYEIDYKVTAQDRTNFEVFKKHLKSKGLHLEKSTKAMKVIVIGDPKPKS